MSAETDFRVALASHAPLTALVGTRIAINAIEQGQPAPYVVFTATHAPVYGLADTLLGDVVTFEAQCWAPTAVQASAVADAVTAALLIAQAPPTGRSTGYDPDLALDAVVITTEWLTG